MERRVEFAPARRRSPDDVARQSALIRERKDLAAILDGLPDPVAVLNGERQIVAANARLRELVGAREDELLGRRPGEALGCMRHADHEGGCGAGEDCRDCGAVLAVLAALEDDGPAVEECRLRRGPCGREGALDLRVHASPLAVGEERFVLFVLQDTTHEKRRQVLERIFFHDALNLAGGVQGFADLLLEQNGAPDPEVLEQLHGLAGCLVEQIRAQRDLAAAECGDLVVQRVAFDALALCEQVARAWRGHEVGRGRAVEVAHPGGARMARADVTLLRRVLGNLVKNALEASRAGETVTLEYRGGDECRFTVRNAAVMSDDVRRQVFQRSFSTRGDRGRGVGLYSVQLLTERYLGGRVSFTSHEGEGTRFTVTLPA